MKRILTIAFLLIVSISFGQGKITLRLPQSGGTDTSKVPYSGATKPLISTFYIQGSSMLSDTMRAATSNGFRMYSSSGSEIGVFGAGGTNFGNYVGRQSYRTNINGSLSSLDFVPKRYVDSVVSGAAVTVKVFAGNGLTNVNDSTLRTDTSLTATKDYVNYKDDIQQAFIDLRKLESDSTASSGYTRRDRSLNIAQSTVRDSLNIVRDTLANHNSRIITNTQNIATNTSNIALKLNIGDSTLYSTKANVTKVRDSIQANLTTGLALKVNKSGDVISGRLTSQSLVLNKDSIPITTTNVWNLTIDTATNRVQRIFRFVPLADTTVTASYTLTARDLGRKVYVNSSSAVTISMPTTSTITTYGTGYDITVVQIGAGIITFAANSNTLNSFNTWLRSGGQYATCGITPFSSNTYLLYGSIMP